LVSPATLQGPQGNPHGFRDLLERKAGEEVHVDDASHRRIEPRELGQRLVQGEQVHGTLPEDALDVLDPDALARRAALEAPARAGVVHE